MTIARTAIVSRRSDDATDAPNDTADGAADDRPNRRADRASRTTAVARALLRASDDALRICGQAGEAGKAAR